MRSSILAAVALATGAFANPAVVARQNDASNSNCMTYDQAVAVANNFKQLIAAYSTDFAEQTLTANFTDYSDSVTELINGGCNGPAPLGVATFSNRTSFEMGQGQQPPIPFEILGVYSACNAVTLRWKSAMTPQMVNGIILLETVPGSGDQPWLIDTVFSEFNSGAWLVNLGVCKPTCSNSTSTNSSSSPQPTAPMPYSSDAQRLRFMMF